MRPEMKTAGLLDDLLASPFRPRVGIGRGGQGRDSVSGRWLRVTVDGARGRVHQPSYAVLTHGAQNVDGSRDTDVKML